MFCGSNLGSAFRIRQLQLIHRTSSIRGLQNLWRANIASLVVVRIVLVPMDRNSQYATFRRRKARWRTIGFGASVEHGLGVLQERRKLFVGQIYEC